MFRLTGLVTDKYRWALLYLGAALFPAHLALAGVMLDQEHDFIGGVANPTNGGFSEVGQTFTVGKSGTLDHIDVLMLKLGDIFTPTTDPELSVYATSGGLPTGAPLVTVSTPRAGVPLNAPGFVSFDVSTAGIAVAAGQVLAFGVHADSPGGTYFVQVEGDKGQPDDYALGQGVSRVLNDPPDPWVVLSPPEDHGFRTYVDVVPEPASVVLLLCGLGLLNASRVRAKHPIA